MIMMKAMATTMMDIDDDNANHKKNSSSGNPESSVGVWSHLWLGFQGNPDWMIMIFYDDNYDD